MALPVILILPETGEGTVIGGVDHEPERLPDSFFLHVLFHCAAVFRKEFRVAPAFERIPETMQFRILLRVFLEYGRVFICDVCRLLFQVVPETLFAGFAETDFTAFPVHFRVRAVKIKPSVDQVFSLIDQRLIPLAPIGEAEHVADFLAVDQRCHAVGFLLSVVPPPFPDPCDFTDTRFRGLCQSGVQKRNAPVGFIRRQISPHVEIVESASAQSLRIGIFRVKVIRHGEVDRDLPELFYSRDGDHLDFQRPGRLFSLGPLSPVEPLQLRTFGEGFGKTPEKGIFRRAGTGIDAVAVQLFPVMGERSRFFDREIAECALKPDLRRQRNEKLRLV